MPKLRNAQSDIGKFAQWIARKCTNHHPLEELKLPHSQRDKQDNIYPKGGKADVFILEDGTESQIVYEAYGRSFKVSVEEVNPAVYAKAPRIKVPA